MSEQIFIRMTPKGRRIAVLLQQAAEHGHWAAQAMEAGAERQAFEQALAAAHLARSVDRELERDGQRALKTIKG